MKRIDVVKKNDEWVGQRGGRTLPGTRADRKEDAVRNTAKKARADAEPVTVKIHKENGRIQEERTYPRKADPPGSKG